MEKLAYILGLVLAVSLWGGPALPITVDVFNDAEAGFEDAVFGEPTTSFGSWPEWRDAEEVFEESPFRPGRSAFGIPNRASLYTGPPAPPETGPTPVVPLPAAIWMSLSGVAALIAGSRWRRRAS